MLRFFSAATLALALGFAPPSLSQTLERTEQLVYWPLVTNGVEYRRIPYPREAGTMLVLAGSEVIIDARYVPVAFWPITRTFLADFSQSPAPVQGNLEIIDSDGQTSVFTPEDYVLWYPDGVSGGPADIIRGDNATKFYQDYVAKARASAQKTMKFQRLVAEQRAAVNAWIKLAGDRQGKNMPPPPPPPDLELTPPAPYQAYATKPARAAVVTLPAGKYTVRLRAADGTIIAGSKRELVSFGPVDQAVGYVLRQGNRWTRPQVSFDPDTAIYTTGETDLYFQPVPVVEYRSRQFTRLFQPQSVETADPSKTMWVPSENPDDYPDGAALILSRANGGSEILERTAYRVSQLPGVTRGYSIDEFEPGSSGSLEPDFRAIQVPAETNASEISLKTGSDTGISAGSKRRFKKVSPPNEAMLFLPALLPLLIGFGLSLRNRRTRKRSRAAN